MKSRRGMYYLGGGERLREGEGKNISVAYEALESRGGEESFQQRT